MKIEEGEVVGSLSNVVGAASCLLMSLLGACSSLESDHSFTCDVGFVDDGGSCVPEACGTGPWGNLSVDDNTFFVDIAVSEGGDGSDSAPFASIQSGLDAAGAAGGGMVAVAAGNYPETLTLTPRHDGVQLAGRCHEMVTIDASAGDEKTAGINVMAERSEAEVAGVTVSGSNYCGILVDSGNLVLRSLVVTENRYLGVVAIQTGKYPPIVEMEGCEVVSNAILGVLGQSPGATLTLRDTIVRDTKADEEGRYGFGIDVSGGAILDAEACEVVANTEVGIMVTESDTRASIRNSVVSDTQPDLQGHDGVGIQATEGATLRVESSLIAANTSSGILVGGAGTSVTLLDTTVRETHPEASGEFGRGIVVQEGATLDAYSCLIVDNTQIGVLAEDTDTRVTLRDTSVLGTRLDEAGVFGDGVDVTEGATLEAVNCTVDGNTIAGISVDDPGSVLILLDTVVRDTHPDGKGNDGHGIRVSDGATLEATGCMVEANSEVGIIAADSDTRVRLSDTWVRDTRQDGDGVFGYGMYIYGGATLEAEECVVEANVGVGMMVYGTGTFATLKDTFVRENRFHDDGDGGGGVGVGEGATLIMEACTLEMNSETAVMASDPGTLVSMRDTMIMDTQPNGNREGGFGCQVSSGATLTAESCLLETNHDVGVFVTDSGTNVMLRYTTIYDTQANDNGEFGYGIMVHDGAMLDCESCVLEENTSAGIVASDPGTSVAIHGSTISGTNAGSGRQDSASAGVAAQDAARIAASGLDVSFNQGPGLYAASGSFITCTDCSVTDNQFAGVVVLADSTVSIVSSMIATTSRSANLGGGTGIWSSPYEGGLPILTVRDTVIEGNPVAGVWLGGEGSFSLVGNDIRGGTGESYGDHTICGDALFAGSGISVWNGTTGLLLDGNRFSDGRWAGLFFDDSTATLSGNTYANNTVDLVSQGGSCDSPPSGYSEANSVELCPIYDYSTCKYDFSLAILPAEAAKR